MKWLASTGMSLALMFGTFLCNAAWADYGAIAYSPSTGNYGYSYGYCSQAESSALGKCGADDAEVEVYVQNGWAALAINDSGAIGWGWSGGSRAAAENSALANAAGCGDHILCWISAGS